MRRRARKALMFPALGLVLGACAEDLGPELEALDAQDSKIVFQAPGLQGKSAKYSRNYNANQSVLIERAYWFGPEARHAKALVQYYKASPRYHLRRETDVRDLLENITAFSEKSLDVEAESWEVNDLGRIKYRRFSFDETTCVVFAQQFGSSGSDLGGGGLGDQQVIGYYCADPGEPLENSVTKQILTSIDVKR